MSQETVEAWDFDAIDSFYETAQTLSKRYDEEFMTDSRISVQAENLRMLWEEAYHEAMDVAETMFSSFDGETNVNDLREMYLDENPDNCQGVSTKVSDTVDTADQAVEKYMAAEQLAVEASQGLNEEYGVSVVEDLADTIPVSIYKERDML